VTQSQTRDELERAWSGEDDPAARRQALQRTDTPERAAARISTLELLDLALGQIAERVDALAAVARAVEERPPRHDTEPAMSPFEVDDGDAASASRAAARLEDDEIDVEPEPEPDVAPPPTPEAKASARAARAAAAAAVERAVEEDVLESAAKAGASPRPAVEPDATDIVTPGVSGWQAEVELLYNDVLRLFSLGDTDGALVSMERLLIIAPINDQIRNFLRVNESKLMKLYEGVMGPWSNVPHKVDAPNAPAFFQQHAKFKSILHLVDGKRDLGGILEESYFLPLETCAVLNQLVRSKVILAHDVLG